MRPYHPTYHPANWRAWWDFGTGSLGDMGCHILDAALLGAEAQVPGQRGGQHLDLLARASWEKTEPKNETFPRSTIVRYKFPAREGMPEVKLTWWDGGMMPPRPDGLEEGRRMGDLDGGVLFLGDKGAMMCGCYGESPRIIPESQDERYRQAAPTLDRIPADPTGTSRTGSAPARAASRPARTSTTPARSRRWS